MKKTDLKFWNAPDFKRQVELISGQVPWEVSEANAMSHRRAIEGGEICVALDDICLTREAVVLEIGCGVGRMLKAFQNDRKVIGIDFSPNMIKKAKEYVPDAELHITDGKTINVPDNSVDFVFSFLVFQHIQTDEEIKIYIDEALRVLRPGGFLRVQTHKGKPSPNGTWSGRFYETLDDFKAAFERPGFIPVDAQEGLLHVDWLWVTVCKK